jgi:hypothetical protein
MRGWVRDHAYRLFDALIVVLLTAAVLAHPTRYWMSRVIDSEQSNIYVAVSAVSATLLGFMIAALTILLMLNTERVTRRYRESGLYAKTLLLFHECAVWLTGLTVAALAGLFVDPVHTQNHTMSLKDAWIWVVCALGSAALWRVFYSLWVLRQVMGVVGDAGKAPTTAAASEIPSPDERTAGL